MASLFGANPFSKPVGQRIEKATDGALPSENWAVNIEICDIINETEEGPKDAAKALRKRLAGNRNYKSVLLTLTVLETCVKNCGHRFHVFIAKKELLDELVRILNPKNNPPQIVQDKILALIQDWADAFRGSPDLSHVVQTYESLKEQGVEFPAQDLDTLSPIYTPERTQPERPALPPSRPPLPPTSQAVPVQPHPGQPVAPVPVPPVSPVVPTPEQLAKLRTELDIVQGNMTVMSEMLTEMTPGQEEPSDLQLLQELNRTCRAMQQRILELIERVANEEVVGMLLSMNDDLNNVFIRYDRYERFRQVTGQQGQPITAPAEPPRPAAVEPLPDYPSSHATIVTAFSDNTPQPAATVQMSYPAASASKVAGTEDSLISFDGEVSVPSQGPSVNSTTQQMQDLSVGPTSVHERKDDEFVASADQDEEFDMFAQSRKSTFDESRKGGSSYSDNVQPFDRSIPTAMSIQKVDDTASHDSKPEDTSAIDSIESWLEITDEHIADAATSAAQETSAQDTLTSSEFDKFLAERAAASGQRSGSLKAGASRPKQRQMQMENQVDDEMFGL